MVGVGRAAREAVLIKDAATLERLEKVDTVVVDKTGTLTEGRPRLTEAVPIGGVSESELLQLAASLEAKQRHPLGRAIVESARGRDIDLLPAEGFDSTTGGGVQGRVAGRAVFVGKRAFLEQNQVGKLAVADKRANELQSQARTAIYVAVGNELAGLLAVSDPIKPSTPEAIRAPRSRSARRYAYRR